MHKDPSGLAVKNVICPNGGSISIDFECCPPARQANLETAMCDAKRKASDAARRLVDLISDIGSKDYVLDTQAAECEKMVRRRKHHPCSKCFRGNRARTG